ncbi:MAG TPA: glycosyltransferase family 39 protein [Pyrinomonadaceae bacterium]|nr:glycosyltransferase family 39 protein [Pyrinomonadaceae bacterium]
MGTASTKSRGNKQKGRQAKTSQEGNETGGSPAIAASTNGEVGWELSRRAWWIAYASVMLVAALVRLYQLELRPMHHDEGVNGFFLNNLIRTGIFRYDPTNYHGPTLYYFTLPLAVAAERLHMYGTWTVRLLPLIFGMATVWLALNLRRYIGQVGALSAAALLALSPGVVFFSRYFIHEMMFVFFTFGIVVAALRFYEHDAPPDTPDASSPDAPFLGLGTAAAALALFVTSLVAAYRPDYYAPALALILFSLGVLLVLLRRYDRERSIYFSLAAVSAALLFATKETAFISVGVLLIAWAMAWGYTSFVARQGWFGARGLNAAGRRGGRGRQGGKSGAGVGELETRGLVARLGGWTRILILLAAALGLFLFVNILFYSSFFTNSKGVWDAVEAYKVWKKTGESGFHGYGWHKYLQWLVIDKVNTPEGEKWEFGEEPVLFLLACAGALLALRETRRRFPLFAALWGFGLLAAYSLIKYKTPWLVLSMLVPFAIAGGYAIDWLYRRYTRTLALGVLGVALAVAAVQTVRLNYIHYDNDRYIYVYAHTKREYLDLIGEINRIAERAGTKYETSINVAAPEYWPMPWYLRDYKRVGYQGRVIPSTTDAVIVASTSQSAEMQATNGANYQLVGTYPMRPGVTLNLYARRDLAGR